MRLHRRLETGKINNENIIKTMIMIITIMMSILLLMLLLFKLPSASLLSQQL